MPRWASVVHATHDSAHLALALAASRRTPCLAFPPGLDLAQADGQRTGELMADATQRGNPAAGLPHHRAIIALDLEQSTSRTDPVKAELRSTVYELFDAALRSAGIHPRYRDRFIDRGDGILALIHPVDRAPKALLLNRVIPALARLLADYNASLPPASQPQRQLRVRVVVHAGEVHYDANGCFGEALDIAFRLLDAARVKKALQAADAPLSLIVSADIYKSVVRHGYDGIDQHAFRPLVRVHVAGSRHPGWIHIPGELPGPTWRRSPATGSPPDNKNSRTTIALPVRSTVPNGNQDNLRSIYARTASQLRGTVSTALQFPGSVKLTV